MSVRCAFQGGTAWNGTFWPTTGSGDLPRGLDGTKHAALSVENNGIGAGDGILLYLLNIARDGCDGTPTSVTSVTDSAGNTYSQLASATYATGPSGGTGATARIEVWWCEASLAAIPAGTGDPANTTAWILAAWDQSTRIRGIWAYGIEGQKPGNPYIGIVTAGNDAPTQASASVLAGNQSWDFTGAGGLVLSHGLYVLDSSNFDGGTNPAGATFQNFIIAAFDAGVDDPCPGDALGFASYAEVRLATISGGNIATGGESIGTTPADEPGIDWTPGTGSSPEGFWKLLVALGIDALPPTTVETGEATNTVCGGAILAGTITPNSDDPITWYFEYGPTTSYGSTTPGGTVTGFDPIDVTDPIPLGTVPAGSTWHFRLVAVNGGETDGDDADFTEGPCPPSLNAEFSL